MAYIGRSPVIGSYKKIDDLTSQFNGTQTQFTLLSGGVGVDPGTSQNLLVSLGGVVQEPVTAYTVSGSTINFTAAPQNTQSFFAIQLGDALDVGYLTQGVSIDVTNVNAAGTLKVTGNATFDTNTLFVDATNDRVGIGNTTPTHKLRIEGTGSFSGNLAVNSTNTSAYTFFVDGSLAATTKSFVIPHPTKPNMKLRYGSLEGPENGVYVRGESTTTVITLPDYWSALVNAESLTVSLTPIGTDQRLYVVSANTSEIVVGSSNWMSWTPHFYYVVYGERQDVPKLDVEI